MPDREVPYALAAWDRARRHQLTVEPLCRMCRRRGVEKVATHVDHIIPVRAGGDWWDGENLQSLCHECHNSKTAQDEGKTGRFGCDKNGVPADPSHPWNRNREDGKR